jgi:hypothetical protein
MSLQPEITAVSLRVFKEEHGVSVPDEELKKS